MLLVWQSVSPSIQNTWNTEASKLGLQGVSVIAASGDDGAPGCMCSTNSGSETSWKRKKREEKRRLILCMYVCV